MTTILTGKTDSTNDYLGNNRSGDIQSKDNSPEVSCFALDLIVAYDKNKAIGYKGTLPWNLPEDLAHFKELTMGHVVIMGRKTFESIGRALPGRINIVVSKSMYLHRNTPEIQKYFMRNTKGGQDARTKATKKAVDQEGNRNKSENNKDIGHQKLPATIADGKEPLIIPTAETLRELLRDKPFLNKNHFIIGGRRLYEWALPLVNTMYITEVEKEYPADTYFPSFDHDDFIQTVEATIDGNPSFTYVKYKRKEK